MSRAQRKDIKQGRTFWIVEPYDGELYTKKVFITRGLRAVWHKWSHRNNQPYIHGYRFVCKKLETIYPDGRRELHPTQRDINWASGGTLFPRNAEEQAEELHRWLHKERFSSDAGFSDTGWGSRSPAAYMLEAVAREDYRAGDYFHVFFGRKAFTTERSALRYMMRIHNDPLYPKMSKWRDQCQKEESELYDDMYDYPDDAMHEREHEDDRIDEQCSCPKCESVEAAMNPNLKYDAEDPGSFDRVLDPDIDRIDNGPVVDAESLRKYLHDFEVQIVASVLFGFGVRSAHETGLWGYDRSYAVACRWAYWKDDQGFVYRLNFNYDEEGRVMVEDNIPYVGF